MASDGSDGIQRQVPHGDVCDKWWNITQRYVRYRSNYLTGLWTVFCVRRMQQFWESERNFVRLQAVCFAQHRHLAGQAGLSLSELRELVEDLESLKLQ